MMRIFGAVMVALALAFAGAPSAQASEAPVFTLRDTTGADIRLESYRGKVVVVQFWATWCGPCKSEMPHLQQMYTELAPKGMALLSISSDDARSAVKVKPYITSQGYTFPVLLDKDSSVTKLYNPQVTLPYLVVIDQLGQIAKIHTGYNPGDEVHLRAEIEDLLAKAPAAAAPGAPAPPAPE